MNPCDLTHYVPESQAIWAMLSLTACGFATGVCTGIFISVVSEEKRSMSHGDDPNTDSVKPKESL